MSGMMVLLNGDWLAITEGRWGSLPQGGARHKRNLTGYSFIQGGRVKQWGIRICRPISSSIAHLHVRPLRPEVVNPAEKQSISQHLLRTHRFASKKSTAAAKWL